MDRYRRLLRFRGAAAALAAITEDVQAMPVVIDPFTDRRSVRRPEVGTEVLARPLAAAVDPWAGQNLILDSSCAIPLESVG